MLILLFFLILSVVVVFFHGIVQKKSFIKHQDIVKSIELQLQLEKQKEYTFKNTVPTDLLQPLSFQLDIIKRQINLLEHIAQ